MTVSVTRDELDEAPEALDPLEDAEPVEAPDPPVGKPVGAPAPCGGVDGALVDVVDAVGSVVQGWVGSVATDVLGTAESTTVVLVVLAVVLVLVLASGGTVVATVEMVEMVEVVVEVVVEALGAHAGPTKAWV
ncbi:MAG: hypothetical protein RLZZ623_3010 [Actinomycetota bacterium]